MTPKDMLPILEEYVPKSGRFFSNVFIFNLHDCIASLGCGDNWQSVMTMFEFIRDYKNFTWKTNFVLQQTIAEVVKEYVANTKRKQPDNVVEYVLVIKYALEGIKAEQFQKFIDQ